MTGQSLESCVLRLDDADGLEAVEVRCRTGSDGGLKLRSSRAIGFVCKNCCAALA